MNNTVNGNFINFTHGIIFFLIPILYCHGPDQVDHNFYLYLQDDYLILRWEIPVGELLGYIYRQKMDSNKDTILSQQEQDIFLKQFTDEHLKNLLLLLNNKKDKWRLLKTELDNPQVKVIPAPMLVKIYLEFDKSELTQKLLRVYLEDRADVNLTQFINFYTYSSITNPVINKELYNGEERIFTITFEISKQIQKTESYNLTQQPATQKISGLYEKIKISLTTQKFSLFTMILILIFACLLGVLHALEPGHGKSIMTAYILATQGTVVDIFILGIIVVFTHTIIVYILAFITLYLSNYILPHAIYPYLGFISSSLIIILGLSLIKRSSRLARRYPKEPHSLHHESSFYEKGTKWRNLIQFGISGGLVPCPAAIAILLTTIQFNKIVLGIFLIIALSFGIAVTLIGTGLAAFYSKRFIFGYNEISFTKYVTILPLFSGIFITALGTIMLFKIFEELKLFKVTFSL